MRALTFKGFLTQYVKELSQTNTLNLRTLAREAEDGNYYTISESFEAFLINMDEELV